MSEVFKKVEKNKSFDKRIEIVFSNLGSLDEADAEKSMDLLIEKAKYPQHYAEIVACAASLPLSDKRQKLVSLAQKANQHPMQAGGSAWVLAKVGYADEAVKLWRSMCEKFQAEHPNLGAQMLAYGLIIPGAEEEAKRLIGEHKLGNSEVDDFLYERPNVENQLHLRHLI